MSIEQALADNTASNLALASALNANTQILEKLEAGREAALAQLESKGDKPATTRRSRAKADEPAGQPTAEATGGNASGAAAGTASQAGGATAASEPTLPTVSEDDLRAIATGYIKGAGENVDDRKARAGNIKSITDNFGTAALAGDNGIKDPTQRAQAAFYLKRFDAGLTVDFSAEYDFAGDPAQGGEPAAAEDSFDGIG